MIINKRVFNIIHRAYIFRFGKGRHRINSFLQLSVYQLMI